jgi:zinc transport system substrate-binding protein
MKFPATVYASLAMLFFYIPPAAAGLEVVTSIKPVHSLVSAVMAGVGKPALLVEGAGSPHNYSLKPSQAEQLENADLIFWIGEELETFLAKPITTIAENAVSIALIDTPDLIKREESAESVHSDKAHDTEGEDPAHAHDHDDHDRHHGEYDMHIWLDPLNAKIMVREIAAALSRADNMNSAVYQANADRLVARLDSLIDEINASLEPVRGINFIFFHDAYQYFEKRFNLTATTAITVNPEIMPGARRIREIQEEIRQTNAHCVFAEPQFEPAVISVITNGTSTHAAVIDPLGAALADGPELYFNLIRNMAGSIRDCLLQTNP